MKKHFLCTVVYVVEVRVDEKGVKEAVDIYDRPVTDEDYEEVAKYFACEAIEDGLGEVDDVIVEECED